MSNQLDSDAAQMRRKQIIGIVGAIPAFCIVGLSWLYAPRLVAPVALPDDTAASRLAYVSRWLLVPGLTLLAGVWIAGRRGFVPDAIDGTRTPQNYALEINLRYNHNTLEQVVLATIAWVGLALSLPRDRLFLIPTLAILFAVGRITFWIGYLFHPMGRAFGMVLTALPTMCAYGWLVGRALGG